MANWVFLRIKANIILTTFQRCLVRQLYVGGVFRHFGAQMGACGFQDMQSGLPRCGWRGWDIDEMGLSGKLGQGKKFRAAAK